MAPQVGLEPTTLRLTAGCSAIELLRSVVPADRRFWLATFASYHSLPAAENMSRPLFFRPADPRLLNTRLLNLDSSDFGSTPYETTVLRRHDSSFIPSHANLDLLHDPSSVALKLRRHLIAPAPTPAQNPRSHRVLSPNL